MNFIHSGATGDMIFSLPVIKDMGGGDLYITNFHKQRSESIKKLIEVQPYISNVIITDEHIEGVNLNKFREYAGHHNNLVEAHYKGQGLISSEWWKNGWLQLPEKKPILQGVKYAVVNRTTNYADPNFDWSKEIDYLKSFNDEIFFVGYYEEYKLFKETFNISINYYDADFLTAAYLMQNAQMVSCCYSCMATIAQGLGIRYRIEQAPGHTCSSFFIERETIINAEAH